ncbi:hypothetical protein NDA13_000349 [Ustilago tritici]|nr:hypothetical protein NDA13_000349 [Ustilago tritici]
MNHNHDSSILPSKASHPPRNMDLHLQSQAIMTPPPSFGSHAFHKSPFASWMDQLPSVPATELRPQTVSIPRSHAFSSLAHSPSYHPQKSLTTSTWMRTSTIISCPLAASRGPSLFNISSPSAA